VGKNEHQRGQEETLEQYLVSPPNQAAAGLDNHYGPSQAKPPPRTSQSSWSAEVRRLQSRGAQEDAAHERQPHAHGSSQHRRKTTRETLASLFFLSSTAHFLSLALLGYGNVKYETFIMNYYYSFIMYDKITLFNWNME
jgi:hypothetical protein